jgi:hypothetical protein
MPTAAPPRMPVVLHPGLAGTERGMCAHLACSSVHTAALPRDGPASSPLHTHMYAYAHSPVQPPHDAQHSQNGRDPLPAKGAVQCAAQVSERVSVCGPAGKGGSSSLHVRECRHAVGDAAEVTKTFRAADVRLFSELSLDTNPIHLDSAYAATTRFGRPIAHGLLVASMFSGLLGTRCAALARAHPPLGVSLLTQSPQHCRQGAGGRRRVRVADAAVQGACVCGRHSHGAGRGRAGRRGAAAGDAHHHVPQGRRHPRH